MNFPEFVSFLSNYINPYSGVPGIIFFLLLVPKKDSITRIVFFVLSASFLADLSNYFFIRYVYPNSYIISNSWYLINFLLVSWLFLKLIPDKRKFVLLIGLFFVIGSILSFSFFYSFLESNTFIRTFTSLAFTSLSTFAFFEILRESPTDNLSRYPVFWILTAIFLYSSVTLLKNLFQNYLVFRLQISSEMVQYISIFNLVFNITKNLMFFYAFILIRKGYPDYIYSPKINKA